MKVKEAHSAHVAVDVVCFGQSKNWLCGDTKRVSLLWRHVVAALRNERAASSRNSTFPFSVLPHGTLIVLATHKESLYLLFDASRASSSHVIKQLTSLISFLLVLVIIRCIISTSKCVHSIYSMTCCMPDMMSKIHNTPQLQQMHRGHLLSSGVLCIMISEERYHRSLLMLFIDCVCLHHHVDGC